MGFLELISNSIIIVIIQNILIDKYELFTYFENHNLRVNIMNILGGKYNCKYYPSSNSGFSSGMMKKILDIDDPYKIAGYLGALVKDEYRAIRLKNWRSYAECSRDIEIMKSCFSGAYAQEPTLMKGGPAVYDFEGDEINSMKYFEDALKWNAVLREASHPFITSSDRISAILGETHAAGVVPEKLKPGWVPSMHVIRKFKRGSRAGPHVDRTDWDWPENTVAATQMALISCLCYHQVAEIGGDVVLYGDVMDRATWSGARLVDSAYEIGKSHLNKSPVRIRPMQGDLLIFNAHLVHEVTEIELGVRVTSSNFFAWRGLDESLGRFA